MKTVTVTKSASQWARFHDTKNQRKFVSRTLAQRDVRPRALRGR